jgi:myo-inositol-1(or 4)-monophosphatase
MASSVAAALRGVAGTEEGREILAVGAGGDPTALVDQVAENALVASCERLVAMGMRFRLRSEELGERWYGADFPLLVVDPVDGSRNAMQGIPFYSTSLAVLDGERLGDVVAGVVRNLAGPGTFSAVRGGGAQHDGRPLRTLTVRLTGEGRIPMLVLEGHGEVGPPRERVTALVRSAHRVRVLGSTALSLCHVATGAASAMVTRGGMRPWDCAAALCLLREAGAFVSDLQGASIDGVPADFGRTTSLVTSLDAGVHAHVLELLAGS